MVICKGVLLILCGTADGLVLNCTSCFDDDVPSDVDGLLGSIPELVSGFLVGIGGGMDILVF